MSNVRNSACITEAVVRLIVFAVVVQTGTLVHGEGDPDIVTVTSLDDHGPGTLRDALQGGDRRIVFKVGGEIPLESILEVTSHNLVVDGTDAPAPGITITQEAFAVNGTRNITLRNLRFRHGRDDNLRIIGGCRTVLIDNCSSTHAGDGAIDITHDYKSLERPDGVTIRNCLIAATDKAMLVVGADNLTLERNLFTNNGQRNPQLHDAQNFHLINNLVRNFWSYGVRVRAESSGNVIGNQFPLSPVKPNRPDSTFIVDHLRGDCRVYATGNVGPQEHDPNDLATVSRPVGRLPNGILPATTIAKSILARAGARPLDRIDRELLQDDPTINFRPSKSRDQ